MCLNVDDAIILPAGVRFPLQKNSLLCVLVTVGSGR